MWLSSKTQHANTSEAAKQNSTNEENYQWRHQKLLEEGSDTCMSHGITYINYLYCEDVTR